MVLYYLVMFLIVLNWHILGCAPDGVLVPGALWWCGCPPARVSLWRHHKGFNISRDMLLVGIRVCVLNISNRSDCMYRYVRIDMCCMSIVNASAIPTNWPRDVLLRRSVIKAPTAGPIDHTSPHTYTILIVGCKVCHLISLIFILAYKRCHITV